MTEVPPILLLLFNRPEKTEMLIKHLSRIKPRKIYIAADGPRNEYEKALTDKTREIAKKQINWYCEIKTLFREENLGLRIAVSGAINWFFENVSEGIILEDDCLPDPTFFFMCNELLKYYEGNSKVMHISALNSYPDHNQKESYHFSHYPRVWGWATWKRAWQSYDDSLETYNKLLQGNSLKKILESDLSAAFWGLIIEKMNHSNSKLRAGSWAYYWILSVRIHSGVCITPNKNLVRNIGFDQEATHTKDSGSFSRRIKGLQVSPLAFPLIHPDKIEIDTTSDHFFLKYQLINSTFKRFKVYLKILFPFLKPFR